MGSIVSEFHCDLHFLSLGRGRKPTKTCVFSAFLEAFGPGGSWPGSVLMYNRFFLNPGRAWSQISMVFPWLWHLWQLW